MKKNDFRDISRALLTITQFSLTVLVPTVGFLFLGKYLDEKLNTGFITVVLVILGLLGGLAGAFSLLKKTEAMTPAEKKESYDLLDGWDEQDFLNISEKKTKDEEAKKP